MLVSVPKYGLRKTTLRVRTPTINSCSENGQKFFCFFFDNPNNAQERYSWNGKQGRHCAV